VLPWCAEMDQNPIVQSNTANSEEQKDEFTIKHPLQSEWVLWYDNPEHLTKDVNWIDNVKLIYKFCTVEDFWSLWNNIKPASTLQNNCNYHLFKSGVQPVWEDPTNRSGGKWVVVVKQRGAKTIDALWQGLVLSLIGNAFEDDDDITGAVVSLRKGGDKIAIWTKTSSDEAKCTRIGKQFLAAMEMENASIGYLVHADAIATNSTFRNQTRYKIN